MDVIYPMPERTPDVVPMDERIAEVLRLAAKCATDLIGQKRLCRRLGKRLVDLGLLESSDDLVGCWMPDDFEARLEVLRKPILIVRGAHSAPSFTTDAVCSGCHMAFCCCPPKGPTP